MIAIAQTVMAMSIQTIGSPRVSALAGHPQWALSPRHESTAADHVARAARGGWLQGSWERWACGLHVPSPVTAVASCLRSPSREAGGVVAPAQPVGRCWETFDHPPDVRPRGPLACHPARAAVGLAPGERGREDRLRRVAGGDHGSACWHWGWVGARAGAGRRAREGQRSREVARRRASPRRAGAGPAGALRDVKVRPVGGSVSAPLAGRAGGRASVQEDRTPGGLQRTIDYLVISTRRAWGAPAQPPARSPSRMPPERRDYRSLSVSHIKRRFPKGDGVAVPSGLPQAIAHGPAHPAAAIRV